MLSLASAPLFLATTNVIEVFARCDPVGQVITVILLIFSVVAWSVMLGKNSELNKLRGRNYQFE
ncbi:MAG TPA: flagellar motor protein MotA, partial [Acidobacteriota bacterium]|nr:flagellar motor protein MotA [Acidobacteriota bacterium]